MLDKVLKKLTEALPRRTPHDEVPAWYKVANVGKHVENVGKYLKNQRDKAAIDGLKAIRSTTTREEADKLIEKWEREKEATRAEIDRRYGTGRPATGQYEYDKLHWRIAILDSKIISAKATIYRKYEMEQKARDAEDAEVEKIRSS